MSLKITNAEFEAILAEKETTVVDFWASWCGPCRMVSPIIDEIANERTDITVGKVNVDEERELAQKFDIRSIPTVIVFKNGVEATRIVGTRTKAEYLKSL